MNNMYIIYDMLRKIHIHCAQSHPKIYSFILEKYEEGAVIHEHIYLQAPRRIQMKLSFMNIFLGSFLPKSGNKSSQMDVTPFCYEWKCRTVVQ